MRDFPSLVVVPEFREHGAVPVGDRDLETEDVEVILFITDIFEAVWKLTKASQGYMLLI